MNDYLDAMSEQTGLVILPAGLVAHTPRRLLQYFGTEYVRRVCDSYWVDTLMRNIQGHDRVLIPDTRFANEVDGIRAAGGRVIKIVRTDMVASSDEHVSERSIDLIEPDLLIGVPTGDLSVSHLIASYLTAGRWDDACRYETYASLPI